MIQTEVKRIFTTATYDLDNDGAWETVNPGNGNSPYTRWNCGGRCRLQNVSPIYRCNSDGSMHVDGYNLSFYLGDFLEDLSPRDRKVCENAVIGCCVSKRLLQNQFLVDGDFTLRIEPYTNRITYTFLESEKYNGVGTVTGYASSL